MKILYMCMGNPFTEDMLYKENYYLKAYSEQGFDVLVLADRRKHVKTEIVKVPMGKTEILPGVIVQREDFDKVGNEYITYKLRKFKNFHNILEEYAPDILVFNCIQLHCINQLEEIKKKYPQLPIMGDTSTAYYNSGRNVLSYWILHKTIYRRWIKKNIRFFDKIFYAVPECLDFFSKVYGVPLDNFVFRPLPAEIVTSEERCYNNDIIRKKYGIDGSHILMLHSGKMDKAKKTIEVLTSFIACESANIRLIIAGDFFDDIKKEALKLIESDGRIQYVGMLSGDELTQLLCAGDLYLQPGGPSQTAQTAIGSGCAVVLAKMDTYLPFVDGNGFLIQSEDELEKIIDDIAKNPQSLERMKARSLEIAQEKLEYKKLANIILDH